MTKYTESVTTSDFYQHRDDINQAKIFVSKNMNISQQATRIGLSHILKEQEDKGNVEEDTRDEISDGIISKTNNMRGMKCG